MERTRISYTSSKVVSLPKRVESHGTTVQADKCLQYKSEVQITEGRGNSMRRPIQCSCCISHRLVFRSLTRVRQPRPFQDGMIDPAFLSQPDPRFVHNNRVLFVLWSGGQKLGLFCRTASAYNFSFRRQLREGKITRERTRKEKKRKENEKHIYKNERIGTSSARSSPPWWG